MFRGMRRNKQQLTPEQTTEILRTQTYGVLSVHGDDGFPYGVPVNYGFVDGKLYLHVTSANSHKLEAIRRNPKVCMTVVAKHDMIAEEYATSYASAIVFGTAQIIEEPEEKMTAMKKMMEGLAPHLIEDAVAHCQKTMNAMVMVVITPEYMTGKHGH